ncbi:hypothetical protein AN958_06166 [Leucoagaricus sp. SymC.cos]|nr:hypothetical protein AN958_06166 [Leucoagaricus sp. SymC.cos]
MAKNIWDTFWEKQKATHERMLKDEMPVMKHARECHEQNKPWKSVKVYRWEWSFDTPPKFGKELVRKADRGDMLDKHERSIKIYDSFFNKWHYTDKFEDDWVADNVSEGSRFSTPALLPPHAPLPLAPSNQAVSPLTPEFKLEHTRMEVVQILSRFFGFVPPLLLLSKFTGDTNGTDKKSLIVVLGLDPATVSDDFFLSPLSMTLSWNLVVPSTTTALYICHLSDNLQEDDVTVDLVQEGIHFHTVQRQDTLVQAPSDASSHDIVSMRTSGHVFDNKDHDFYHQQCEYLATLPRGHAALMHGGFTQRIAMEHIGVWDTRDGPCGIHNEPDHMFIIKDSNRVEYIDDNLTNDELDALCGLYITFTGQGEQTSKLSYYPLISVFEGQGLDMEWWTDHIELLWQIATKAALNLIHIDKLAIPMNSIKWCEKI